MSNQKALRVLGYFLLFFSIVYMVYSYINQTGEDKMYIVYGLLLTSIGSFLATYGNEKKE